MLHIILGILKIIGIILGIILLVLLAALLGVVFVPVRYRIQAEKQPQKLEVQIRVTWLCRIISITAAADRSGIRDAAIRLFGIRLPFFKKDGPADTEPDGKNRKKPKRKNRKKKNAGSSVQGQKNPKAPDTEITGLPEEYREPEQRTVPEGYSEPEIGAAPEGLGEPELNTAAEGFREPEQRAVPEGYSEPEIGAAPEGLEEPEVNEAPDTPEEQNGQEETVSVFGKMRFKIKRIYDKIKQIINTIRNLVRTLLELPQKAAGIWRRMKTVLEKPGQALAWMEQYEVQEILSRMYGHLKYLLRHFGPRRMKGYLHFGTGDPALTGRLTGIVYLLLPARADLFEVRPDFHDAVFETEVVLTGRIRACHVLWVAWKAFRDKKLRRLIRSVRGK